MRCFVIAWTVLLACISPAFAQGWQWLSPLPQGNTLADLDYLGNDQLLSVGYSGTAIGSTDGGVTWTLLNGGEIAFPTYVDFASATEGWGIYRSQSLFIDSLQHAIFHTSDGGQTWQQQYYIPAVILEGISCPTPQICWVTGHHDSTYQLVRLQTVDGGLTWVEEFIDADGWNSHVFFLNELEGWISVYLWALHTTDGGANWQWYASPFWTNRDLYFLDSQHGWAPGYSGNYYTADSGQTWSPLNVPLEETESIQSIAALDTNNLYVVTSTDGAHLRADHVLSSTDGGASWTRSYLSITSNLYKIIFADPQNGWICGANGVVCQTMDGSVTWTQRGGSPTPELYYNCVDFVDPLNGWMGGFRWGQGAPILHTTDGGIEWTVQYAGPTFFYDIAAVSETNIWAVGNQVLHSTNGGEQWGAVDIGMNGPFLKIVCSGDQIIWLVSGWYYPMYVHRSTNGGESWSSRVVPLHLQYGTMAAAGENDVWVAGWADLLDEGSVYHSSDGGESWETQADSLGFLESIFFVDPLNGWASTGGDIVRTTDGGDTWMPATIEPLPNVAQIQFLDMLNGWAITYNEAFRTTDGGNSWQRFSPFVQTYLADFDVVDINHAWTVGPGTTLLRFDGTPFSAPDDPTPAPSTFVLHPAYPNPFNAVTTLSFDLPTAGRTRVEVFDITGRHVQTLTNQVYPAGRHTLRFDAGKFTSGLYFAQATSGPSRSVQKLVLLK